MLRARRRARSATEMLIEMGEVLECVLACKYLEQVPFGKGFEHSLQLLTCLCRFSHVLHVNKTPGKLDIQADIHNTDLESLFSRKVREISEFLQLLVFRNIFMYQLALLLL